jgi:glyoxylate carboligase
MAPGPLGWTLPPALRVRAADPDRDIVALSGDYDFQFPLEELAVGAQHKLPYLHVVVNKALLRSGANRWSASCETAVCCGRAISTGSIHAIPSW